MIQEYLEDLFGAVGVESSEGTSEDATPAMNVPADGAVSSRNQQIAGSWAQGNGSKKTPGASSRTIRQTAPEDLCAVREFYNPNEYRWGDQRAVIYDYRLSGTEGSIRGGFDRGQKVSLEVAIFFSEVLEDLIYGFTIKTVDGRTVFGANTRERGVELPNAIAGQRFKLHFEFVCALIPGEYFISVGIAQDDQTRDNVAIDRRYDLIHMPINGASGDFGVADVGLSITCIRND